MHNRCNLPPCGNPMPDPKTQLSIPPHLSMATPDDENERGSGPTILGVLTLMIIVAVVMGVFFFFIRSANKEPDKITSAKAAAMDSSDLSHFANDVRPKSMQPLEPDPQKIKKIQEVMAETGPQKSFATLPEDAARPRATGQPPPKPQIVTGSGLDDNAPRPASEPVHEISPTSPEGAALLKDADARIEEAPNDLYSEKAKAKVREGLKMARRIFKVYTVYFEKGGASPEAKDKTALSNALQEKSLVDSMGDPRTLFFVLGFADKSGDPQVNKKLSAGRADAVVNVLKNDCGLLNLIYPVSIGSSELVSPGNQNKNRAAEVWMVLP